jgi:protein phosphatase
VKKDMPKFIKNIFSSESGGLMETTPSKESNSHPNKNQLKSKNNFNIGRHQSIGKVRDHNEDALLIFTYTLESKETSIDLGLFIVADGMGGHLHGEIASDVAVRVMASHIIGSLINFTDGNHAITTEEIEESLLEGVLESHQSVIDKAPGGGTTLTTAFVLGNTVSFAHVGDSRAYLISQQGELQAVTRDHSLVSRMVEMGKMTLEEAETHPQRNILYRALGQTDHLETDIFSLPLDGIHSILLCSDGLWGVVPEEQIAHIIHKSDSPQAACKSLVTEANNHGGPDNITAILVNISNT